MSIIVKEGSEGFSCNINRKGPNFLCHLIAISIVPRVISLTARPFQDKNITEQVTNPTKINEMLALYYFTC